VPRRKKWVQKRVRDRAKADRHYREYYLTEQEGAKCFATWLAFSKQRRLLRRRWYQRPSGGEALRKRCIRGRKLRALIVWKYYQFLAKHCKLRAMSWFRRLRKDDESRRVLAREVSRASGVKKHELTQELAEFDSLRVNPPPIPVPAEAACFYVAPSEEELERREAYQNQKKLRMKEHKKLVLIGRKRAKAFNASVRSRTNQEVRNEKRKREKDEDASQARLAVESAMDAIETKRCTETTLSEDQQLLCAPLLAYFESKVFPREVSAAYLRYWRAGPAALELLRDFATQKRQYFSVLWCLAVPSRVRVASRRWRWAPRRLPGLEQTLSQ
jgi:hypothetical protein